MNKKVIVAIDLSNLNKAITLVRRLKKEVFAFKIGHEFFYNFGIKGYKEIYKICPKIFLDLKLHDIPNTVKNGIKAIQKLKPLLTTVHISGGDEMMRSCINNRNSTKVLGVSILTSMNNNQTKKYYGEKNINKLVKKYVKYAKENKLDGIVCSPLEIKNVREIYGKKVLIVVPGIRPENYSKKNDDQSRFVTPKKAIKLGADLLVIGRPITNSDDPLNTLKTINRSLK